MNSLVSNTNNTGELQGKQSQVAALYARVSTSRQEQQATIESQIEETKRRILSDGNIIPPEHIYIDNGWSGEIIERPSLDAMRDAATEGHFKLLYVYDRGRLSRRFVHQEVILDELREKEVEFISLHDIEAKTPEEMMMQSMMGIFHEYERFKIAERFRRGKLYKAKSGALINGNAKYGYRYIKRTDTTPARVEVNEEEARVVRMVWHWFGYEGMSINNIKRRLYDLGIPPRKRKSKFWTKGPIRRLLSCETYVSGIVYYNKSEAVVPKKPRTNGKYKKIKKSSRRRRPREEWIPYRVTPLIEDVSLYDKIKKKLSYNKRYARKNRRFDYLLTGKIYCSCGNRRAGDGSSKHGHFYYRCSERIHKIRKKDRKCHAKGVNAQVLDKAVWKELKKYLTKPELIKKHAKKWLKSQAHQDSNLKEKQRLNELIAKVVSEEERYAKAYGSGSLEFDQFTELMKQTKRRKTSLQKQLVEVEQRVEQQLTDVEFEELASEATKVIKSLDLDNKKQVIRDIIEKVTILERSRVEICAHIPIALTSTEKLGYEPISRNCRIAEYRKIDSF